MAKPPSDDVRSMFDRKYLGCWDLRGENVTVTIARVEKQKLRVIRAEDGKTEKNKPIVYFENTELGLVLNKVNMNTIAAMYGYRASDWKGKRITLYPTQIEAGGKTCDTIRVRPTVPKAAARSRGVETQPIDEEMRAKQEDAIRSAEAQDEEADHGA